MNKKQMFHKTIIFSAMEYLTKQIEDKDTYLREDMVKIVSSLRAWANTHRFSKEEAEYMRKLGEKKSFQNVRKIEVDYSIYALSLLYLYTQTIPKKDRPHINVSDKRIQKLKSTLVMDMLGLKARKPETHKKVKEITSQSQAVAKLFLGLLDEELYTPTYVSA